MPKWTKAQEMAINIRDKNLLVSAAAGSGKTAVLVERIIRLILEEKIDINRLLIVTFTNAAAGEMRERILDAFLEQIEKGFEDEKHIRRQITLLNKSYITTLHSFCIDVVRKNFHLIDIDPSFRIGDFAETNILIQETLDELLEEEYERADENFITLVEGFGGSREDIKLQELILRVYGFIQSKPYPKKWLNECVEKFTMSKEEFEKSQWINTIKSSIRIELNGARDVITEALKLCNKINGPKEYETALLVDLGNVDSLLRSLDIGLEKFYLNISDIDYPKFKQIRGSRKLEVDNLLQEQVKELRNKYKDIINKSIKENILTKSVDEYVSELNKMYPVMKYLERLVNRFSEKYSEKKLDKGILDFNDLEHYALKVLEYEEVQRDYRNHFEYIFVDEYQDSNIVQETILNRIKRENNLFMVGDVKQSIYRFRLADPSLFIEKYETYAKEGDSLNKRIDLSQNFRTRVEILEGINFLFKNIMSKELGEIDYTEDAYLYKGLEFKKIDNPHIELNIIENKIEESGEIDEELEEMSTAEVEARFAVKKIKELIGKKTYNAKMRQYMDIDFRHIVILLRSPKNWAPIFAEVFAKEGIPLYSDDSSGYFNTLEINIFLDLLRLIDNKRQDIPLLSVMRSPIGNFTTDELIKIRLNKREGSYYSALEAYIIDNEDKLSKKIKCFIEKLDKWAYQARYFKLDEFIWKLLIETGYYHYVGAMPGGIQRQANLRVLVDRAYQFEKSAINGLFLFLRFIDKLTKSRGDMGAAKTLGENENVVRIMSVHKSKGLEFPVVICTGLGKKFNLTDTRRDVLLHRELGLGPKFIDVDKRIYGQTLPQIAIKRKMKIESLSEEMRILYVALTRAVDRLILIGSVKDLQKGYKKWSKKTSVHNLIKANSYLDWICSALFIHKDGEVLRNLGEVFDKDISFDKNDNSRWIINLINKAEILLEENDKLETHKELKNKFKNFVLEKERKFTDMINKRFNWEYRYKNAEKIPSKLAVSDIKKVSVKNLENIAFNIPSLIKKPKFIEGKKPFTKAEIGTIVHFVMQHIDLNKAGDIESIRKQIDMMVVKELLTEEEAKVVDEEKIMRFFKSPLGKRILSAEKVYREVPFVLRKKASDVIEKIDDCEEVLIQGVIDCYFEEDGKIVLIDYKTSEVFGGNINSILERYKAQIDIYKEALEKITGKVVKESYIYLFDTDEGVKV
ncbi:DNA helicase/exodeoxyribonuclease V, subunit A [Caminicella sporogenes DSM 14501]|uniref:ATP-dependent helicase/nuclease subunit A n=1 Tax=Caminicella sporogenes DSM 14501 TaxID=1121266 RepID=A0A1M6SNA7_9FIRM|nr:helicase-exonuclease AddAB subunit AddA [Caminicella sporogenes]RKD26555.1 helicase-exonuclease AddAB subunit AddA [Caminicella sporogenes]SHK46185.1 DNA helicase/exodeoxyribonuclease V, subunit A [Caminicella sporogenes DSM 14501]